MFLNYFKIAFRHLRRDTFLSGINVLGLSAGIASCLLIALYIFNELSYDRFHKNASRIVRATMEMSYSGNVTNVAVTGTRVLPEFKRVFPEVEDGVRTFPANPVVSLGAKSFREKQFVYADSAFFEMFSFTLLKGDPRKVLNRPDQLVLTVSAAKKYFGSQDALGKVLRVNNEKDYVITGIAEDCPLNSQIKFDMLASWSSLTDPVYTTESWFDASHYTYLLLRAPGIHKSLESTIQTYFKSLSEKDDKSGNNYLTIHIQPLTEVHLNALVEGGFEPGNDVTYIYLFSIIALFILGIACANYVNLTIAKASERAKEVGLRKVVGASRKKLMVQFMGESFITVFIALVISLFLVEILLPAFNLMASKQLTFAALTEPAILKTLGVILIIISFLGGLYPSMILSGFNTVNVLKGNYTSGSSGVWLRKSLVVFQFGISVGLIVSTFVIQHQLYFIQHKKLGYDKDHVIMLRTDEALLSKLSTVKSTLLSNPDIVSVTICNQTPVFIPGKYSLSIDDQEMLISGVRGDKDFIRTLGLSLLSGSDFTEREESAAFLGSDSLQRPVVLNESAVHSFGWTMEEAIGKKIMFQGRDSFVKGVVGDFHYSSMRETIGPIVIFIGKFTNRIVIKLSGQNLPRTLTDLETKWTSLAPHLPFEYQFLDEEFNNLYRAETRIGKIFYAFALLGIGLACLGLLGLITFTAQQRTKEIGIRKVLGASILSIMTLLSKDLMRLICIAVCIALPTAWWLLEIWLQGFAYHTSLSFSVFVLAGLTTATVSLLTLGFQSVKAALANPVNSLRSE